MERKEAHLGRDTHPACPWLQQPNLWVRKSKNFICWCSQRSMFDPQLISVSAVVSPYLLLPLLSRLVTWRTAEWNPATSHAADGQMRAFIRSIRKTEFHKNPKFAWKADSILLSVCRPWLLNLHILPVYPFLSSPLCSISVIAPSVVKPSEIVAGEVRLPSTRVTIIFSSVCVSDSASEHGSISHIIQLCSLRAVYMGQ